VPKENKGQVSIASENCGWPTLYAVVINSLTGAETKLVRSFLGVQEAHTPGRDLRLQNPWANPSTWHVSGHPNTRFRALVPIQPMAKPIRRWQRMMLNLVLQDRKMALGVNYEHSSGVSSGGFVRGLLPNESVAGELLSRSALHFTYSSTSVQSTAVQASFYAKTHRLHKHFNYLHR